jgi:hypothetical protein
MEGAGSSREFVEGCKLQIKTTLGEDIEGHVLTYDKALNIVVLHILCSLLVIFGGRESLQDVGGKFWGDSFVIVIRV